MMIMWKNTTDYLIKIFIKDRNSLQFCYQINNVTILTYHFSCVVLQSKHYTKVFGKHINNLPFTQYKKYINIDNIL